MLEQSLFDSAQPNDTSNTKDIVTRMPWSFHTRLWTGKLGKNPNISMKEMADDESNSYGSSIIHIHIQGFQNIN